MKQAYHLAQQAYNAGEVPVGAVLVHRQTGQMIAGAHNQVEANQNALHHAEMLVLAEAFHQLKIKYLMDYDLYVTLEPCPMCAASISMARIGRLYFGAYDPKSGGVEHGPRVLSGATTLHHIPEVVGGIMEEMCGELMTKFFAQLRK